MSELRVSELLYSKKVCPDTQLVPTCTVPPPEMVVVIASRTAALFEGTTGLVISCEVTLNNTGVDTDTVVTRGINGPGAARGRVSSSPQGVTLSISPLALSDDGLYTCTTSVGSKVNTEYILTSTPTLVVYTLTVMGESQ